MHKNLFQAYFKERKNIGDREVLLQLAEKAGFLREEVQKAWQNPIFEERLKQFSADASKKGATGVPTFVINDRYRIVGAQPYEEFQKIFNNIAEENNK
ncbi:DsbA family protein [Metallumcola ferriviriculae]|uniref:DsbA family protein n=1 Tax=Metallumcola ferriviriculae TaxID=3039180 RepID=A0AAU0UJU3_9FIRM|nr:DsbA family protein [Desulfitibacteraceae bacterium MK1]